ncbi:MAG TPA: PhzF family phenazine biosynthesis protein [Thermoanaerobaculia bacterium]|nr:PhzF family phenazine biosynthesis protein [Thermoanaerobaculia bacterium]
MKIPAYHVDAFAGTIFAGNPAMVCPLERWLDEKTLQLVASENGLPVTAFFVEKDGHYELRWFTPTVELKLCGHGTLAAASVLFETLAPAKESVTFETKGGSFDVVKEGPRISMNFPALEAVPCATWPEDLVRALGKEPKEVLKATNYMAVYEDEADIRAISPNMELLKEVDALGVIVTARGKDADFVSRYFAPKLGIPEDAATGSAHCTLAPYWSKRLRLGKLRGLQLSQRRGEIWCEYLGDRVRIAAQTARYGEGFVYV